MKSLLEDLYYQKFSLKNDSIEHQKRLCEVSSLIDSNEGKLRAQLNAEELELFEKYFDCIDEMRSLECCDEFLTGFRLGGRIVMEIVFGADNLQLRD